MFSEEFMKDFEAYGKDSAMCKHALEQLRKSVEIEKSRKKIHDIEKIRKELIDKIHQHEKHLSAIHVLLTMDEKNLSKSTRSELASFAKVLEADKDICKQKLLSLKEEKKPEYLHDATLADFISLFF